MIEWLKSWFTKQRADLSAVDQDVLDAYNYACQKVAGDPSTVRMSAEQERKELLEWTAHYLRENK